MNYNKEITVTSDNDAVKINGYKANVDVFQPQDTTVNLTVSFTREGVTVSRRPTTTSTTSSTTHVA